MTYADYFGHRVEVEVKMEILVCFSSVLFYYATTAAGLCGNDRTVNLGRDSIEFTFINDRNFSPLSNCTYKDESMLQRSVGLEYRRAGDATTQWNSITRQNIDTLEC